MSFLAAYYHREKSEAPTTSNFLKMVTWHFFKQKHEYKFLEHTTNINS
jgi:hypothetical protein